MDTLIERYIAAVSEQLPAKQRKDVTTEIRSLIQDALDDRSKTEAQLPDDRMITQVLKEFGPPEKIVAPYLPERYLIGPRLFPTFLLVLRIALPIIAVLVLVTSWIGTNIPVGLTTPEIVTQATRSIGNAFSAVVTAFGNIVLIFAILQWTVPEFRSMDVAKTGTREWDPHQLKAIREPDKIKRGELITEVVFTLLALIIFNFYFDRIGIYNNLNGQWSFTPILTEAFRAYIPWMDLVWVLTIILDIEILRRNAWNTLTRIFTILLSAFSIAISASLLTHIDSLYTIQGALGQLGPEGLFKSLINQALIIALVITIIASVVKILQMLIRIVRSEVS
jgi:large-conductance mechanosensitive channel